MTLDQLKEEYNKLLASFEDLDNRFQELYAKYEKEKDLNNELIVINKKLAENGTKTTEEYVKFMRENERMKKVLSKGAYFEYDNDPETIEFIPILGDLTKFKLEKKTPSRLMYTFTFKQLEDWLTDLHKIVGKEPGRMLHIEDKELE